MSGYWDALERTAQGLSGSAGPRPRALFEDELALPFEPIEEIEAEAFAQPAAKAPAAPAAEAPAPVHQAPTVNQQKAIDAAAEHVPARPAELAVFEPSDERTVRPAVAEPAASAVPATGETGPAKDSPLLRVIESHEIESVTIVERLPVDGGRDTLEPQERSGVAVEPAPAADAVPSAKGESLVDAFEAVAAMPAEPVIHEIERVEVLEPEGAPPVVVEIGSIEVRIEAPPIPTPPAPLASRNETGPAPSLGDYLEARSGGSR